MAGWIRQGLEPPTMRGGGVGSRACAINEPSLLGLDKLGCSLKPRITMGGQSLPWYPHALVPIICAEEVRLKTMIALESRLTGVAYCGQVECKLIVLIETVLIKATVKSVVHKISVQICSKAKTQM